jgi:hypothetical protein
MMLARGVSVVFSEVVGKPGNAPGECEDVIDLSPAAGRVAVCDGATEASYAAEWARILARSFPGFDVFAEDFRGEAERWFGGCLQEWLDLEQRVLEKPLQWFARAKLTQGASATFLGLAFEEGPSNSVPFRAIACGDTCLFVRSRGGDAVSFPLEASDEFNTTPPLLSTTLRPERAAELLRVWSGSLAPGDAIYMATDALAAWILLEMTDPVGAPWAALDRLQTASDLEGLVAEQVAAGRMREDDVALVRMDCHARSAGNA